MIIYECIEIHSRVTEEYSGCLVEKKRWLACLDGGEERLAAFLVL